MRANHRSAEMYDWPWHLIHPIEATLSKNESPRRTQRSRSRSTVGLHGRPNARRTRPRKQTALDRTAASVCFRGFVLREPPYGGQSNGTAQPRPRSPNLLRDLRELCGSFRDTRLFRVHRREGGPHVITSAPLLIVTVGPVIRIVAPLPLVIVIPTSLTMIIAPVAVLSRMPPVGPGRSDI